MGLRRLDQCWAAGAWSTLLVLCGIIFANVVNGRRTNHLEEGLELSDPKDAFRSEGGSLEVWSSNVRVLQEAGMSADRITLERRGLGLFKYSNAAKLGYVLEGKAKVGVSYTWDESVHLRTVEQGDIIAIPRGVGHWWYNVGVNRFVVLGVADTADKVNPGEYDSFYLNGGSAKDWGSAVFHGFDEELLSHAWDLDRDMVRQIRDSQKGTVIIKLPEDIEIPSDSSIPSGSSSSSDARDSGSDEAFDNYTYNIDQAQPDIEIDNGGSFKKLTSNKLPILREVRLSAFRVILDQAALFAPSYISNANLLIYVTRGSGRIQIIGNNDQLLDAPDLKEGSVVVVPKFHPYIKKAGNNGLEFVAIATSDDPRFSYLAGRNAIYRSIPVEVLAASNNVPIEVQKKIFDRRQNDAIIFPPRGKSDGPSTTERAAIVNDFVFDKELTETLNDAHIQL